MSQFQRADFRRCRTGKGRIELRGADIRSSLFFSPAVGRVMPAVRRRNVRFDRMIHPLLAFRPG
jgi:hypothetical protein